MHCVPPMYHRSVPRATSQCIRHPLSGVRKTNVYQRVCLLIKCMKIFTIYKLYYSIQLLVDCFLLELRLLSIFPDFYSCYFEFMAKTFPPSQIVQQVNVLIKHLLHYRDYSQILALRWTLILVFVKKWQAVGIGMKCCFVVYLVIDLPFVDGEMIRNIEFLTVFK